MRPIGVVCLEKRALVAIARELLRVVGRHLAKCDFEVRAHTRGLVVIIDEAAIGWVGSCVRAVCRCARVVAAGTGVPRCARFTCHNRHRRVRRRRRRRGRQQAWRRTSARRARLLSFSRSWRVSRTCSPESPIRGDGEASSSRRPFAILCACTRMSSRLFGPCARARMRAHVGVCTRASAGCYSSFALWRFPSLRVLRSLVRIYARVSYLSSSNSSSQIMRASTDVPQ